jgi:hypothetical protein
MLDAEHDEWLAAIQVALLGAFSNLRLLRRAQNDAVRHHALSHEPPQGDQKLNEVPGNKSFRDTVKAVAAALESEEGLDREQV